MTMAVTLVGCAPGDPAPPGACLSIRGGCRRRPGARGQGPGARTDWASV